MKFALIFIGLIGMIWLDTPARGDDSAPSGDLRLFTCTVNVSVYCKDKDGIVIEKSLAKGTITQEIPAPSLEFAEKIWGEHADSKDAKCPLFRQLATAHVARCKSDYQTMGIRIILTEQKCVRKKA
jgi:hypothetical protein